MRSRWEGGGDVDADDAPANLTERDVKALRRRDGFGIVALLFALLAIVGLAWTLFTGPEGLARIQDLKQRTLPGTTTDVTVRSEDTQTPAPPPPPGGATESGLAQPTTSDSASTTTPSAAAPGATTEARTAANQRSGGH